MTYSEAVDEALRDAGLEEDRQQLRAGAQALADVRTLDGAATTEQHWVTVPDERSGWRSQRMVWKGPNPGLVFGAWLSAEEFYGATPDEARAKAVAWAREHR